MFIIAENQFLRRRGDSIFEMFESENSSGIGLPVSRELVRRHGGDLWCEESPDGHPNFVFTLPKE